MKDRTLEQLVKDLLWNIGNQREKVLSTLNVLLPQLYPNYSVEDRQIIKEKILENIK